jgi:hypothetical protein
MINLLIYLVLIIIDEGTSHPISSYFCTPRTLHVLHVLPVLLALLYSENIDEPICSSGKRAMDKPYTFPADVSEHSERE